MVRAPEEGPRCQPSQHGPIACLEQLPPSFLQVPEHSPVVLSALEQLLKLKPSCSQPVSPDLGVTENQPSGGLGPSVSVLNSVEEDRSLVIG